jgi:hypothetical protein
LFAVALHYFDPNATLQTFWESELQRPTNTEAVAIIVRVS